MYVSVTIVFFPTNMKLHYFQKNEDDLFPKNTPKDDIFAIAEKDDTHLRKKVFLAFYSFRNNFNNTLYFFYGDLFKCFHILLSSEKTRKLSI